MKSISPARRASARKAGHVPSSPTSTLTKSPRKLSLSNIAPQLLPDRDPLSPNVSFTDPCGGACTIADGPNGAVRQALNVAGLLGNVTDVKITITGLTRTFPQELDFLLVGPDGTHNLEFWSDAGGGNPGVSNRTVSIADPTGNNNGIATFASSFAGIVPNGNWTLLVAPSPSFTVTLMVRVLMFGLTLLL